MKKTDGCRQTPLKSRKDASRSAGQKRSADLPGGCIKLNARTLLENPLSRCRLARRLH